jgi:GT2 family glycosyltransferase
VTNSSANENVTYGGFVTKSKKLLIPNSFYQNADYCNGNCVLVPRNVFDKLGNLDPIFHHALGDFDYSLRARCIDIAIYISPEFIGNCERHESEPQWQSSAFRISERLKKLYLPSSGCNPYEFFIFERRHNGIITAIFHFITLHIRAMCPSLWRIKLLFV